MRTSKNLLSTLALCGVGLLRAQDGQLSQYGAAPVMLNPALAGMDENEEVRMAAA